MNEDIAFAMKLPLVSACIPMKMSNQFCISQQEVLFVGIIDTLVPFKMKKKAEFMAKSLLQHGQNFSVRDIAPLSRSATNISTVLGLLAGTAHGERLVEGHVLYRIPPAAATLILHTHVLHEHYPIIERFHCAGDPS